MTRETITVLQVDDESSVSDLITDFLEREDSRLTIRSEPSAEAGLERLKQDAIDCILSDYDMPDMDGLEFLKAVRAEYPTLPFILYTGKGSEEIAAKAIDAGVDAYHQKKVGTGQYTVLAQQIVTLVEKHTAEQRLDYLAREQHIADGGVRTEDKISSDENNESVSMVVVEAVAERKGIDPVALTPPLYEAIDPDTLDALFAPLDDGMDQETASITFPYDGYTVTVYSNGQVDIDE